MIGVSFARCAGWLHKADGGRGVVLCSAHGLEELCARRSWKALADRLAAAGMPTLRFDYHGTADSDGSSDDPGRVEAWRSSIREAVHWLEDNLGVTDVVVIGLRAGALLAALEAERHGNIRGLGLLAPPLSGRDYVRDLQALSRVMSRPRRRQVAKSHAAGPGIEVSGFCERPETIADIEALSFASLKRFPARDVLLLSQRGVSLAKLRDELSELGCRVSDARFAGYEHMVCDPAISCVPDADLDNIVEWAVSLARMPERRARSVHRQNLDGDNWVETGVRFGPGRVLTGVLCQPQYRQAVEPPVIFLNAGMSYHIGWGRMTVDHARSLAEVGVPSLRIDSAGLGDSGTISGLNQRPVYSESAEASLVCAVDWLEAHGFETPTVVGACSGAYAAFHGLRTDARIKRAVVVNLQCFRWTPSIGYGPEQWMSLRRAELMSRTAGEDGADAADAVSSIRTSTLSAASTCLHRAGYALRNAVRLGQMRVSGSIGEDIRAWFKDFSERGCEVLMVYSAGDAGLAEFQHRAGPMGSAVTRLPGISLRLIDNADRNLTAPEARAALLKHMTAFLGLRSPDIRTFITARQRAEPRYERTGSGV